MNQKQAQEILNVHLLFLGGTPGKTRGDFAMETLEGLNLSNVNLENAILTLTCFRKANLSGANLKNTKISGDCSGSDFRGSKLENTSFKGACLWGAKFDCLPKLSVHQLKQVEIII